MSSCVAANQGEVLPDRTNNLTIADIHCRAEDSMLAKSCSQGRWDERTVPKMMRNCAWHNAVVLVWAEGL